MPDIRGRHHHAARTPTGKFQGSFKGLTATQSARWSGARACAAPG